MKSKCLLEPILYKSFLLKSKSLSITNNEATPEDKLRGERFAYNHKYLLAIGLQWLFLNKITCGKVLQEILM